MNPAPTYPLTLRINGRKVVVVGGGHVAARRALGLRDAGALVTVVSPDLTNELSVAVADGSVAHLARGYEPGDLEGAWLVQTATHNAAVDDAVMVEAESRQIWCMKGGDPDGSHAWVPAVARTDDIIVAVNAGRDSRRAGRIRDAISTALATGALPLRRTRVQVIGSVALVGGGPGTADLITTRGRRLLAQADVVVIDRLAPQDVLEDLDDDVLVVNVGKRPGHHPIPQREINDLLVSHASAGKFVVRLKGGDPYVFGRGGEEAEFCRAAGLDVEVVPGVTSAIAVPAAVGIPVTHRGLARGFSVLTGHEDIGAIQIDRDHTLVLLMGVSMLEKSCARLLESGRNGDTPVAVIESGMLPEQRVIVGTLSNIVAQVTAAGVEPPAVTVVGDVVTLSPYWTTRP
ncbi:MAG: cobA [Nocardioidaceae bacterium]|nr:cobA [Nocardioidaceae bacterium]